MRVWDLPQGTIKQFAVDLAQSGGLTEAEHYHLLLAAIWRGEISAKLRGDPITPELLRNGLRLFDGRWCGTTSLVVKPEHAGKRLGAVLRKLYPTLNPDALARMVNGYAPPQIAEQGRDETPPVPKRCIFLDGAPTELSARLRERQWITLPEIEPFVSDVPFDVLAGLPWPEGYSNKYRKAYLDRLFLEPEAVLAWLERKKVRTPMPTPLRCHASQSAIREWYSADWVNGEWQEWMKKEGYPSTVTPNADHDLLAAREKFGKSASRDMIREARRDFAPANWTNPGKRKL